MTFDMIEQCLNLVDSVRQEHLVERKRLIKLNFKFNLEEKFAFSHNETSLLEPFCSPFCVEEKRWFVAYDRARGPLFIYSVQDFVHTKLPNAKITSHPYKFILMN
jgi:hypothetical protein